MATTVDTILDIDTRLEKRLNTTEITDPKKVLEALQKETNAKVVVEILWQFSEELRGRLRVAHIEHEKAVHAGDMLRHTSSLLNQSSCPPPALCKTIIRNLLSVATDLGEIFTERGDSLPIEKNVAIRLRELAKREAEKHQPTSAYYQITFPAS